IESIWDTDLNDWGLRKKYEYTFDSNGNLTLDKESWWDTDLNDWEVHWKSEYYWSIPSEVGELNINDIFTVFPNPTSGNLSIKGEVFLNQHVILEMTNLRGQSVYSNKLFLTNIDHNIILPKLPKGMYLLTIKANSINSTQKIFIE
ncbi:MAG: T9SS type A sorting domain-containing protein, partial [Lentimicrobiaceae bacterium]|nr:T9SS type A sorting domain-containing protein [Lentimicrobiaceae bacterium]